MSFDKNKAMRNAERFLSQGKIRAAINEYERVVENDPKDFSTLNILGDLHAKNRDKKQALGCFTQVAEHYNTQGFSHKAIAVYNKISRIEPGSIEISAKLAELYQSKGSVAEARQHYKTLAEHYQQTGQKIEALAIWKQIAELDPNNTEIYTKIGETCLQEKQFEEAARAFTESGLRFIKQTKFESAITAFTRALEIKKDDLRALKGLVKSQIGLGCADEAAHKLEEVLTEQPHNRDALYLLVDCYLDMNNAAQAERAVIRLVEEEPANYLKFLDLVKIYLKSGDLTAATRILAMAAEHLLVGGQSEEFLEWTNEILARNPEHTDALRLLVRFYGWHRREDELKQSLERLAEAARLNEAVEEEHYALSQLVVIAPQDSEYARRLQELGQAYGLATQFAPANAPAAVEVGEIAVNPQYQNYEYSDAPANGAANDDVAEFNFADLSSSYQVETFEPAVTYDAAEPPVADTRDFAFYQNQAEATPVVADVFESHAQNGFETSNGHGGNGSAAANGSNRASDDARLQKEIDSIEYYIEQGYFDLAARSVEELETEFGARAELAGLRDKLNVNRPAAAPAAFETAGTEFAEAEYAPGKVESVEQFDYAAPEFAAPTAPVYEPPPPAAAIESNGAAFESLDELKSELDPEDAAETANRDDEYETHYHLGTAYKEMGLLENAIREFQDAIVLVGANDGTRRFFQCANHLGHCFMDKQMPKAAAKWFLRDLEVEDLTNEERQAIYYDLGDAFEASGETSQARHYFEQLYAENIDYRNVGERLADLQNG